MNSSVFVFYSTQYGSLSAQQIMINPKSVSQLDHPSLAFFNDQIIKKK